MSDRRAAGDLKRETFDELVDVCKEALAQPNPLLEIVRRGRPPGSLELRGRATRATWTVLRRSEAWRALSRAFGDRLRELRRERKIAASELAAAVGVSTGTVMAWERGRLPGPLWMYACSVALGCALADLLPERAHRR